MKIKITFTMTEEQALWLWQLLENSEDTDGPWAKFFQRLARVVDRARQRHA